MRIWELQAGFQSGKRNWELKILELEVITKIRYATGDAMRAGERAGSHWGWGDCRHLNSFNVLSWYIKFPGLLGTGPMEEEWEQVPPSLVSITEPGVMEDGRGDASAESTWGVLIRVYREWKCNGLDGAKWRAPPSPILWGSGKEEDTNSLNSSKGFWGIAITFSRC